MKFRLKIVAILAGFLLFVGLIPPTPSMASSAPTVSSVERDDLTVGVNDGDYDGQAFGPVAGGTQVIISGSNLSTVDSVKIGVDVLTEDSAGDDQSHANLSSGEWSYQTASGDIYAITPERADTNLWVGAQQIVVSSAGVDSTDAVYWEYRPVLTAVNEAVVALGELASRTQAQPVTSTTGSSPYTVIGTDSRTEERYTFETNTFYDPEDSDEGAGWSREGQEIVPDGWNGSAFTNGDFAREDTGRSDSSQVVLESDVDCGNNNPNNNAPAGVDPVTNGFQDGTTQSYCSVFGPEVFTEPFRATDQQALAFAWKAVAGSDHYEVYAFLVAVEDSNDVSYSTADHTLLTYGRGQSQSSFKTQAANIPTTGLYKFRFVNGSYDGTGGKALGADMFIRRDITVGLQNSLTVTTPSDQVASGGTYSDITVSVTTGSGAQASMTRSGTSNCSIGGSPAYVSPTTTFTISASSAGTCVLTASAGASGSYAPASDVIRSFSYRAAPTVPSAPTITAAEGGAGAVSVTFSSPSSNGGAQITNYQYSTDGTNYVALSPADNSSPITIPGLSFGTSYNIKIKAVNSVGAGAASNQVTGTPASVAPVISEGGGGAPAVTPTVPTNPPTVTPRPRRVGPAPIDPSVLFEPFLQGAVPSPPPIAPTGRVGGLLVPIQTQVTSPTGFSLRAGVLNLGLEVQQDQGVVRQNNSGGTEIEVRKGSTTALTGSGLLPRSTVQVFLPLQGPNAKEIARIPVDDTGAFSGDAVFATRANERPLPIGRQLLQVVALDEDGQQSVVEMTVNIAQPAPAPEPDRTAGATPTLRPGQFLATNAGEPEIVTVVPIPEDRQARVEGDGWQMAVDIPSANGSVAPSDEGGALLQLVRDEMAVVSGAGFMPGTRADVWLFSEPTLLGTVDIDENGEFTGDVNIDSNVVVVGEHTLQLQGVGEDGYVRAANLGVVVNDTAAEATTEEAAGGFLWWLWLLVILVALVVWFALWRYRGSRRV